MYLIKKIVSTSESINQKSERLIKLEHDILLLQMAVFEEFRSFFF